MDKLIVALIIVGLCAISFFVTDGLVWLVCWAFHLVWSWRVSIGIWAILWLVSGAVKSVSQK